MLRILACRQLAHHGLEASFGGQRLAISRTAAAGHPTDGVTNRWLYTPERMVLDLAREHVSVMQISTRFPRSARPADNELYDRGCDLVEAAAAIRQLAAEPSAARAVPAALGCLEAALGELRGASEAMRQTTDLAHPRTPRPRAATDRTRRGLANLGCALTDAQDAATAARSLAARSLGA